MKTGMDKRAKRIIIGLLEQVVIKSRKGNRRVLARIDTGATKSSMDAKLAQELHLGPVLRTRLIKSAHGTSRRPVISVLIRIAGKTIKEEFTLAERSHMKYTMLIGHNILLHKPFLVDPHKKLKQKGRKSTARKTVTRETR